MARKLFVKVPVPTGGSSSGNGKGRNTVPVRMDVDPTVGPNLPVPKQFRAPNGHWITTNDPNIGAKLRSYYADNHGTSTWQNHPAVQQVASHVMANVPVPIKVAAQAAMAMNNLLPEERRINPTKIAGDVATKIFSGPPGNGGGGNGSGGGGGSSMTTMNASYGLSKAPNPKPVYLNSRIMPNAFSNDYMYPVQNNCSTMHVNNVLLGIPTDVTNPLYTYFTNTIAFDIQTRAQTNVNFALDVSTSGLLGVANILKGMNYAISALQIYYFYTSILSYESDPRNKNAGMIALRGLMSAQLISDVYALGKRLEDTPIPPRIVQWVRYMNMNFLSGNTQGSAVLKLGCDPGCLSTVSSPTLAAAALANLNDSVVSGTFSLIRRAIPKWRIGKLYDVPSIPVFDKDFLTIFANSPMQYLDTGGVTYRTAPNVTLNTDFIAYNSYNNKLDGAAYAMSSAILGGIWMPGIVRPITSGSVPRSRLSYYTNGTTVGWYGVDLYQFLTNSRQETYTIQYPNTVNPVNCHLSGSDKLQGVSITALTQTAQNFLDYLFQVDGIPHRGKLSNFNSLN